MGVSTADGAEDGGALDKDLANIGGLGLGGLSTCIAQGNWLCCAGVHEEVDVALPVAELGVFEAVVLVRQRKHGFGEKGECRKIIKAADVDCEFAGAGAEEMAADADVVAEIEQLVESEGVFSDVILADVDLEALATLLKLREAGLALDADRHDATCDADLNGIGFQLLGGEGVVGGAKFGNGVARGVAVGISRLCVAEAVELAEGGDLLKLFAALLVKIFFELRLVHSGSFGWMSLTPQYSDDTCVHPCATEGHA
jgi:hypothetical protein